jgi:hypothetical protein
MANEEESKIIRLPRNGPKSGQSMSHWLHGKDKTEQRELERLRWQHENKGR